MNTRHIVRFFAPQPVLSVSVTFTSIALAAFCVPVVSAQTSISSGTIQGTITDSTGAVVSNAAVTVSEPSTGASKKFTTNGSGLYAAGSLAPGVYKVHVEASGFSSTDETVVVQVGNTATTNIKLNIGNSSTDVQVQANALSVDTTQTSIQGVLTQSEIQALPVNGRNFLDLAQLEPGVQIQDGSNFDPTKNGFSSISFGGRYGRTARIDLDGLDISDENVGTTTQNISEDAIQEFQVAQSNLDISSSITSSGSVNIVTKSGSNTIHGDEFYLFRDKRAGGADFPGGENNYLQRNNVGGSVGGSFIPDKAFYFFSAENFHQALDAPVNLAGTPLAPISAANPSFSSPFKELELLGRSDFVLPHGARFFVRGGYDHNTDVATNGGGSNYSPYLNENNTPNAGIGLDFLTGSVSHSFRLGYFKFVNHITDATQTGAIYNPLLALNTNANILVGGTTFSSGTNTLAPQTTVQSNRQIRYDGSWTKGPHTLRYGLQYTHVVGGGFASFVGIAPQIQTDISFASVAANGIFAGGSANPLNYPVEVPTGTQGQAVVLGNGQGYDTEKQSFGFPGGGLFDNRFNAYIGDVWKVLPKLTINYGVRYVRDTGRSDNDLPAIPLLDQVAPGLGNSVHQPSSNFGPQAGFAYDLTGKGTTVIRGGAGIYFENNVWNNVFFDRPVRLSQGLFFGDAGVCPNTSITIPGGSITQVDGVTIASLCGQPIGSVARQFNDLEKEYQADIVAAGPQGNNNYIGNTMAVGPNYNGDQLFYPGYKSPESYQFNVGVQQAVGHSMVVTADYQRNVGLHFLQGIDYNHVGDVRNFNLAAAQIAVANTLALCNAPNLDSALASCPADSTGRLTIQTLAANGLDSGDQSGSGAAPTPATATTPGSTVYAFGGHNPAFGQVSALAPIGRSLYNAFDLNVREHASHPVKGVMSSDIIASYTYSRFDSSTSGAGDQDFGNGAYDQANPSLYFGPNGLDRRNQFSISLDLALLKGFTVDAIAHLYSSLPTTLTLPTQGPGDIFINDVTGDGTVGDILPGTNIGAFGRSVNAGNVNKVITNYNSTVAGQPTPAGTALINSGLVTAAQLAALGGVAESVPLAPSNQVNTDILRTFDLSAGYNFKAGEALTISPSVHAFNILNAANFDAAGTPGQTRIGGILSGDPGTANNTTPGEHETYRVGLGSGVYAFGAPRQLEFGLRLAF